MIKTIERSLVDEMLAKLSPENRNKVIFKALKKGATILRRLTEGELAKTGIKYSDLLSGIRLKAENAYSEVKVHIMGNFKLKFFERGTKPRLIRKKFRKGSNRGAITATHFFSKARRNTSKINQAIAETLNKEL